MVRYQSQSIDIPRGKLKQFSKLLEEKRSGASLDRPELKRCLEYVNEGETLVVTKLGRLACSTHDLCNIPGKL